MAKEKQDPNDTLLVDLVAGLINVDSYRNKVLTAQDKQFLLNIAIRGKINKPMSNATMRVEILKAIGFIEQKTAYNSSFNASTFNKKEIEALYSYLVTYGEENLKK